MHPTNDHKLMAWYTANFGVTWIERDSANAPVLSNVISSYDAYLHDGLIHVATQESVTGRVAWHVFDMGTKAWATVDDEVLPSTNNGGSHCVSIECRHPSGEPVIFFQGERELVSGIYYGRGWYSIRQSGAWSSPVMVTPTPRSYLGKPSSNCNIQRVVAGRENRMHFFYEINPAERWVSWSPDDWARTMQGDLTFGSALLMGMTSVSYPAGRNISSPVVYQNREKIILMKKVGWGHPYIEVYAEGPSLMKLRGVYTEGQILGEGGGGGTHNPSGFVGGHTHDDCLIDSTGEDLALVGGSADHERRCRNGGIQIEFAPIRCCLIRHAGHGDVEIAQCLVTARRDARAHDLTLHDRLRLGVLAFESQFARLGNVFVSACTILRHGRAGPERVFVELNSLGGGAAENHGA